MSTEAETTATAAEATTRVPRQKSLVSTRLVAGLEQAERYATVAQRPDVAAALEQKDLTPAFVTDLADDVATCRGHLARFVQATTDRQVHTERERGLRLSLVVALQAVQSGAKRKWARTPGERDKLKGYFVGTTLKTLGFASLSEAADTILRQARLDSLPGVSAADLTGLESALTTWKATNEAQAQAQNTATVAHQAADALAKTILDRRLQLQLAADVAFPYDDKANAAIRKEFGLPKNGPFSTV